MDEPLSQSPDLHHAHATDVQRLGWALGITGTFMVLEVVGGWLSGSLALLADAGHMLTDTAALALALGAALVARRPSEVHRPHGHHRAQVLAAFVNAVALLGVVGWIVWEAVERLREPRAVAGGTMLGIALLGLVANLAVLHVLREEHDANINVAAARLHVLGDEALQSRQPLIGHSRPAVREALVRVPGRVLDQLLRRPLEELGERRVDAAQHRGEHE